MFMEDLNDAKSCLLKYFTAIFAIPFIVEKRTYLSTLCTACFKYLFMLSALLSWWNISFWDNTNKKCFQFCERRREINIWTRLRRIISIIKDILFVVFKVKKFRVIWLCVKIIKYPYQLYKRKLEICKNWNINNFSFDQKW